MWSQHRNGHGSVQFNSQVLHQLKLRTRRFFSTGSPKPPVIVCPYVNGHERDEIRAKFGLDGSFRRKLKMFLWHDVHQLGPERAYQYCWDQFPDRDVIILHSDMAPMPGDRTNCWYDELLFYRDKLPEGGMLGCNLFYPRREPCEPWVVQCAGGIFCEGEIQHIRGPVKATGHANQGEVAAEILSQVRAVDWITFGGILIRREVIRACGSFDPRYRWAYVMDVDYSLEARQRGFQLFQVPVSLLHEEGRTTRAFMEVDPILREHVRFNYDLFYRKWRAADGRVVAN